MTEKNNAIATANSAKQEIMKWGDGLKDFAMTDYDHKKFIKSAIIAITENHNLIDCMNSQEGITSLYHALSRAATTGLSLNPQEGKACVIAYNKKASYQIMKNGMIDMIMDTGEVKSVVVDIVRENDVFQLSKTVKGDEYTFQPARKNRGDMDGVFCAITLNSGDVIVKYMTVDETNEIRDNYSIMYRNKKEASPWHHSYTGMAKKTVIKTAIRDINISTKLNAMIDSEDDFKIEKELNPVPEQRPAPEKKQPGTTSEDTAADMFHGKEQVSPNPKVKERKDVRL